MKIRRLEKEEHQVVRPLYEEVFSEDSTSFVDYYFTDKDSDEASNAQRIILLRLLRRRAGEKGVI